MCLSLFSDGLSTTTPTLLFNLFCLANDRPAQRRILKEVEDAVGDAEDVTAEHLAKMPFLKAFIKETFRFVRLVLR